MSGAGPKFCKNCGELVDSKGVCKACGTATGIAGKAGTFLEEGQGPIHKKITDRYVASAHDVDMNDALRRMADVHPDWIDKACTLCKKICAEGAIEAPSGSLKGKPLCEECYTKTYTKGECAKCHQGILEGEYVQNDDGRMWHKDCFSDEHRCATCRQPIFGEVINAIGKDYHPKCFQCGKCQKPLDGYVNYHGAAYCSACANEAKTTHTKAFPDHENAAVKLREANNAAAVHRQGELRDLKQMKHIALGDICVKCKEEIITNGITVGEGMYHEECFVCTKCGKGFPDGKFAKAGDKLYHAACAKAGDKCPKCNQAISGKYVEFNGEKIHGTCFKCGDCKTPLAGQSFGEDKGEAYCINCMKHHTNRGPSGVHTGAYTPGFTVNPVTGEKEQRGVGGAKLGAPVTGLGTKDACPLCNKPVYFSDSVPGPKLAKWHRKCLQCMDCQKNLDSNATVQPDNKIYCRDCVGKHY